MKRNLALIISVLMALALVLTFASCGGGNNDGGTTHVHTYDTEWTSDANAHWHYTACGAAHEKIQADYANHSFGDDGKCTVCGYCNHLLDNKWSSDISSHWHETNCDDHKGQKPDVASHTFEGATCTVCGYVCDHGYANEWTTDNQNHWYKANCNCELKPNKDFGAHVDDDRNGVCDTCNYVICANHADEDKDGACDSCERAIDKALYAVNYLNQEAVAEMNSFFVDYYKRTVNGGYEALTDIVASVKYYDNYVVYSTVDGETFYCTTYGDEGTLFIIRTATYGEGEDAFTEVIRDTNVTEMPTGTTVLFIDLDYEVTATSAEELISKLYALENKAGFVMNYDEATEMVSFSFAYVNEYEDDMLGTVSNVFVISVEFSFNEETNGVNAANVKIDKYNTADVTIDTEADTYAVAEGAEKLQEVVYGITQTFGEAFDSTNEPNPYPAEGNVVTEDFTLVSKDEEGNVTGTYSSDDDVFTVIVGEGGYLYFDDATAAALGYSTIEITSDSFFLMANFDSWDNSIYVGAYVDGEYVLTVVVEGIEVSITVVVEYKATTEFEAGVGDEYGDLVANDTANAYVGTDILVGAIVGYNENPYTTYSVVEGNADDLVFTQDGKKWAVRATVAGTYVIELTSASNSELKDTVTLTFVEAPSMVDLLTGTYVGTTANWLNVTAVFTAADETTGTVSLLITGTIHIHGGDDGNTTIEVNVSGTYAYEYNAQTGLFALTLTEGNGVEEYFEYLALENYEVVAQLKNDLPCTLEKQVEEEDDDELTATTSPFYVTITDTYAWEDEFIFVAGAAGNYTFNFTDALGFWSENSRAPEVDYQMSSATSFTMTLSAGQKVVFTVSAPVRGTYEVTFTFEAAEVEEPTVEPGLAGTYIAEDVYGNSFTVVVTEDTISFQPPRSPMVVITYVVENGVVTLYIDGNVVTMPMMANVTIDTENNVFATLTYNTYDYTLTKQPSTGGDEGDDEGGESTGIEGTYTATDSWNGTIDVIIDATTVTFGFYNPRLGGYVTDVYEYTIADGAMTLTRDGEAVNAMMAAITLTDGVPTAATYNGTSYTLTKNGATGGDEEEPTGNELVLGTNEVPVTGDNAQMTEVTFTATEAGEYTFTAGEGVVIEHNYGYTLEFESVSFTLEAGETITLYVNNMYYTAGTGIVTVEKETAQEPQTNTLTFGNNTIVFTEADMEAGAKEYTFYALVNGQYTFASNDVGARVFENGMMIGMGSVHLDAGKTYTVVVFAMGEGTYTLNITAVEDQIGGGDEDDGEETGTEENPTVWDEIPDSVTIESDTNSKIYFTFTATQSGTLTIVYPSADSWADLYAWENNEWNGRTSQSSNMKAVAEFTIEAGVTYRLGIGTFNNPGEFTLPISVVGGGNAPEGPAGNVLVIGENTVVISEADAEQGGLMFTFTTFYAGLYEFASNDVGARIFDGEEMLGFGIVTLEANKTYNVFVGAVEAGTYNLDIIYTEESGEEGGDEEEPEEPAPTVGTQETPVVLEELGDYTCEYTKAYGKTYAPFWYSFVVTENGYITVSSTFDMPRILIGTDFDSAQYGENYDEFGNPLKTKTIYAFAGTTVYIGIGSFEDASEDVDGYWGFKEGTVPFTVSFEAFESESYDKIAGTWTGEFPPMWEGASAQPYTLTVNENGEGTLACTDFMGDSYTEEIVFVLIDGTKVTIKTMASWGSIYEYVFTYDVEAGTLTEVFEMCPVLTKQ